MSEQSFELSVADVDLEPEDRPHCRFATKSNDTSIDNGNRTQNCDESLLMTVRTTCTDNELAIELPANNISQQDDIQVPPTGIPIPIDTGMVVEVMEMEEGRGSELVSLNPPNETIDFGYRSYAHNFGADAVIEKESDTPNLTNDEQETDGKSTCLLVAVSESQYTVHSGYSPKTKQAPCPKTQPKVTTACQKAKKVKSAKASPSKLSPPLRSSISSKSQSVPNCSVKSPKSSTSNEIQLEMVKKSNVCVNKSLEVLNVNSPNKTSPQKNKPCDSSNDISIVIPDKPTKTAGKRTAKVNVSHAKIAISKGKTLPEKSKKSRKSKAKSEESVVKPPKAKKVKQSVDIMETTARCKGSRKKKKSLPVLLGLSKLNPLVVAGDSASKKTKKNKSKTNKKSDSCAVVVSSSSKGNSLISKSLTSPKPTKSKPKTKSSTLFPKEKGIKVKGCKTKLKKKMGLCVTPLPVASQLPMNSPTENNIPPVLEIVTICKVPKKNSKSKKSDKKSKSGRSKFGRAKVLSQTIVHTDGLLQVATKLNRKSKSCKLHVGKKEKKHKRAKKHKTKEKHKELIPDKPGPPPTILPLGGTSPLHILIPDEEPIASPLSSPPCPPSKGKGKKSGSGVARLMSEWLLENGDDDDDETIELHQGKPIQSSPDSSSPKSNKMPNKETSTPVSPVSSSCFGTPTKIPHVFAEPVKALHESNKKRQLNVEPIRQEIMEGPKEKQHKEQTPSPQSATTCMSEETMFSDSGIGTDNNSNPDQHVLDKHRRRSVPSVTESDMSSEIFDTHPLATSAHGLYSYGKKDKHRKLMNWHFGPHRKRRKKYRFMRQPGRMSPAFVFELDAVILELRTLTLDHQEDLTDVTKTVYNEKQIEPKNHLSAIAKLNPNYSSYLRPSYLATVLSNPAPKNSKHKSNKKKKKEKDEKRKKESNVEDEQGSHDMSEQYSTNSGSNESIKAVSKASGLSLNGLFQSNSGVPQKADFVISGVLSLSTKTDCSKTVFGKQRTEQNIEKREPKQQACIPAVEKSDTQMQDLNSKSCDKVVSKKSKSKKVKVVKSALESTMDIVITEDIVSRRTCTKVKRSTTTIKHHQQHDHVQPYVFVKTDSFAEPLKTSSTVDNKDQNIEKDVERQLSSSKVEQTSLQNELRDIDVNLATKVQQTQAAIPLLVTLQKPPIRKRRRKRIARFTPPKSKAYMKKRLEILKQRAEEALLEDNSLRIVKQVDKTGPTDEMKMVAETVNDNNNTAADFENNNVIESKEEVTDTCHQHELKQPKIKQTARTTKSGTQSNGSKLILPSLSAHVNKKKTKTKSEITERTKKAKLTAVKTKGNVNVKNSGENADICRDEEITSNINDVMDSIEACIKKCSTSKDAIVENSSRIKGRKGPSKKMTMGSSAYSTISETRNNLQESKPSTANSVHKKDNIFDRLQNSCATLQKEMVRQEPHHTVLLDETKTGLIEHCTIPTDIPDTAFMQNTCKISKKQHNSAIKTPGRKRNYKAKASMETDLSVQSSIETGKKSCMVNISKESVNVEGTVIFEGLPSMTLNTCQLHEESVLSELTDITCTRNKTSNDVPRSTNEVQEGTLLGEKLSTHIDVTKEDSNSIMNNTQEIQTFTVAKNANKSRTPKVQKKKLQMTKVPKIVVKRTVETAAVDESSMPLKKRKLMKEPVVTCTDSTLIR